LQKEFGPKGLVVVGVTNEPESLVTKAVDGNRMKFPVAMTKGEDFERAYGVEGFPSSYLVDADGFVAWQGHPGNFDDDQLTELLKEVWVPPALPEKHAALAKLLGEKNLAKAKAALDKALAAAPDDAELKAAVESIAGRVTARLEAARAAEQDGDPARARKLYQEVVERFGGIPEADEARTALAALAKDKGAQPELQAADKLAEAIATWRKGDLEKGLKAMRGVAKKHEGTRAGAKAAEIAALYPD
jgi:thioredoxin-like negative regulator of GroEL